MEERDIGVRVYCNILQIIIPHNGSSADQMPNT